MHIRDEIAAHRKRRVTAEGHCLGVPLPVSRKAPPVPFGRAPFVICEIKRRSPSKGDIAPGLDARARAEVYAAGGIQTVSVLTEEDYFKGSLADLVRVKEGFPDIAVLRKDFLLDEEDIEVSYRAGADAVLLIAGMLEAGKLYRMYETARDLGMECLVEVHGREDVDKARPFTPRYVGINSRDLRTFRVDPLRPMKTAGCVDWAAELVFESGVRSEEEAVTVLDAGFSGLLVGEGVVTDPGLIPGLVRAVTVSKGNNGPKGRFVRFWPELAARRRPLVKICGITNAEDAEAAAAYGADVLGFVFADSPRRAETALPAKLRHLRVLKAAVVTGGPGGLSGPLAADIRGMLEKGDIDAVQFHGNEPPEVCFPSAYPYYKAVRVRGKKDIHAAEEYRCPRVLFDAFSSRLPGGTGKRIDEKLAALLPKDNLWLAGGLGPDNIRRTVREYSPELVDASSLLEKRPGKKDHDKVKKFFQEIEHGIQ